MKKLTILCVVAFVGLIFSPLTATGAPAGPPGGLDVKIIDQPVEVKGNVNADITGEVDATITGDVNVVNSAESPLYITPSDTLIPFSGIVYFDQPSAYCEHFDIRYGLELNMDYDADGHVPSGYIAVVKHISCEAKFEGIDNNTDPTDFFKRPPEMWDGRGGSIRSQHFLPYPTKGPAFLHGGTNLRTRIDTYSAPLEVYVAPGAHMCSYLPADFTDAKCFISGYLMQIP